LNSGVLKVLTLVHPVIDNGFPKYLNVRKGTFSHATRLSGTLVVEKPTTKQKTVSCGITSQITFGALHITNF
jgi:hypothetical protein